MRLRSLQRSAVIPERWDTSLNVRYGWKAARGRKCTHLAKPNILGDVAAMARYFFNIVEDGHKVDAVGVDYPNPEMARTEAVRFAAELLGAEPERVWKGAELRIEATDTWGTVLFTLLISGVDAEALARHK